jgi:hypothetical protein
MFFKTSVVGIFLTAEKIAEEIHLRSAEILL